MSATTPYRIPPRSIHSRLVDPRTGQSVWPLRIVERHLSTPAPSRTRDAGSPDPTGAAVEGAAAPKGIS